MTKSELIQSLAGQQALPLKKAASIIETFKVGRYLFEQVNARRSKKSQ